MKTQTSQPPLRYIFLDVLRIIAITQLLAGHIILVSGITLIGIFKRNYIFNTEIGNGVTLFLILSGLALELNYGRKIINYAQFVRKRLAYIYPIYWISLLFGIGLFTINTFLATGTVSMVGSFHLTTWICSFLGMCPYVGQWGGPFLSTGWFIGLIIPLYLLYPLIKKLIHAHPHLTLLCFLIISVPSYMLLKQNRSILPSVWFYRAFPPSRLFEFGLGVYFGYVLPTNTWFVLNNLSPNFKKWIRFGSELSFPLFLVHYPLLFMFRVLKDRLSQSVVIILFLLTSILLAWLVLVIKKSLAVAAHNNRLFPVLLFRK